LYVIAIPLASSCHIATVSIQGSALGKSAIGVAEVANDEVK